MFLIFKLIDIQNLFGSNNNIINIMNINLINSKDNENYLYEQ